MTIRTVTGVYGVTSYTVRARRREIGIRVALGLALGVLGAAAATRVLTRMLYEVKPLDVPTFIAVGLLLAAFAAAGSYLPARRAATVDPMESVRCE